MVYEIDFSSGEYPAAPIEAAWVSQLLAGPSAVAFGRPLAHARSYTRCAKSRRLFLHRDFRAVDDAIWFRGTIRDTCDGKRITLSWLQRTGR
jgi:hypothetical protein